MVLIFVTVAVPMRGGDGFVRIQGGQATRDATGQSAKLATSTAGTGDDRIDTLKTSGGGGTGGDASAANQVAGNNSLSSIDTKLSSQASAANQALLVAAPSRYREPAQGATKAQIKGSAGTLNGYSFVNPNAYPVYAKLYDALAASVTVGTTVPVRTIAIPSGGFIIQENAGVALTGFSTGITIAVTKLLDDTDATVLDTPILAEVFYK